MKILNVLNSNELDWLRNEIHTFTNSLLAEYLNELEEHLSIDDKFPRSKDIHDAVWGIIHLNSGEVLLLDSPLIQRLRRIKHLGLADLLFPGAGYSRFEHTLGVVYVSDKISNRIFTDKTYHGTNLTPGSSPTQIVRLAAFFHDIGHMFASHASERFFESPLFSKNQEIDSIENFLMQKLGSTNVKLGEMISSLMLTSTSSKQLLDMIYPYLDIGDCQKIRTSVDDLIGNIVALIFGVPISYRMLPFSQIINGSIDADKCDYLARDSHYTGVPVAVDLNRVIQKLGVVKSPPKEFSNVWEEVSHDQDKYCLLAIDFAALKSVEEILISRTLMHEKVYFHHKILTSEQMLREAIRLLDISNNYNIQNFNKMLFYTDDNLISLNPELYLSSDVRTTEKHSNSDNCTNREAEDRAIVILKRLAKRKLLKRACVLTNDLLIPVSDSIDDSSILLRDIFEVVNLATQTPFLDEINSEVHKIISLVEDTKKSIFQSYLPCILVGCPPTITSDLTIHVAFNGEAKLNTEFYQGTIWDNSRKMGQRFHFIASEPFLREHTFIATEKVIFQKYGYLLRDNTIGFSRLEKDKILLLKDKLASLGYYRDSTSLLPINYCVRDIQNRVEKFVQKWSSYDGPDGYKIRDSKQIISFLHQFLSYSDKHQLLIEGLLRLLDQIKLLGRKEFGEFFKFLIDNIQQTSGNDKQIVSLGNLQDSSSHIAYYMNDVENENLLANDLKIRNIQEAIDKNPSEIYFFDDAFHSGTQVIGLFEELMSIPTQSRKSGENHEISLTPELQEKLKKIQCKLFFCYGQSNKIDEIQTQISNLGLSVNIYIFREFPIGVFNSEGIGIFESIEQKELIKNTLKAVGIELLTNNKRKEEDNSWKTGWNERRIEESSLGYANAQQCIITAWNTPTYTLTPLWSKGRLNNGCLWIPLFPRQRKNV